MTDTVVRVEGGQPERFAPYASYRDSDIDWLSQIPADWNSHRLRFVVETRISKKELRALDPRTEVSFVPMEAIHEHGGMDLASTKPLSDVLEGYTYFRDGDVLVAKITPCFENGKGALAEGLCNNAGLGTTELHVLRPSPKVDARFLLYLTLSQHFRRIGTASMYGAGGQKRVSGDFIRNFHHPLPSLSEQRAIADFLDREAAKIGALVAKKERLIKLLQEKRTALITHAVTRGLDPEVPMKDSGVEWLGEMPSHWHLRPLKRVSPEITVGVVVNPSSYVSADGVPFLYGSDVQEGRIVADTARRMSDRDSEALSKSRLEAGDLVCVRVGAPGVTAVVPPEIAGANCASVLIVRHATSFSSQWLCYTMNSRLVRHQVELVQYGAAQEQFNVAHAVVFLVPLPPRAEQAALAAFLDSETSEIDNLIAKIEEAVDHLNELRIALISGAVTGKIDVREPVSRHDTEL
ncbi:MAG: restriction endonuclease subunit S [Acidobacteriota bacterium]|nr:restriction endonuclease subunit S [Acidobacteriota bacterium]